MEKTAGKLN